MKYIFTLSLFFCFSIFVGLAQSHTIQGQVTDLEHNPIPFANIFTASTGTGTAANEEGFFKLLLPTGQHELSLSAVGYKTAWIKVAVPNQNQLVVELSPETYTLQEVVIGNQEDPAYALIRKAIAKRKTHLNNRSPYTANVYIKGLQRLLKAPRKFFGVDIEAAGSEFGLDSNRTGIVYLSESESKISSIPPRDFKEEMISSKVSGSNRAFSFNRASDLQMDFYENYQDIFDGLSNRPFISPIAENALTHYRYRLLGSAQEGGQTVYKIQVIPKRKAEPLYKGDLYLTDDDWRIHSVNFLLDKEANLNFVDSLHIKQQFSMYSGSNWMPSTVQLNFEAGALGFEIGGYFTAIYQDYRFDKVLGKKQFKEVLAIGAEVNDKDSVYWSKNRPVPLTEEEEQDYLKKDSLRQRRESKAYLDSLDQNNNRFRPIGFLTSGYFYRNRYQKYNFSFDSPITSVLFNSVEGLAIDYGLSYSKQVDSIENRWMSIRGNVRYGFANKRLNAYGSIGIPIGKHRIQISGGSNLVDLNSRGTMPALFNSVYTLFLGENYKKWHEKTFASALWDYTLPGNIRVGAGAEWARRTWLPNATDFTFWERNHPKISSNNPFTPGHEVPLFDPNRALTIDLRASYNFSSRYATYPSGRVYLPSKYPTWSIQYKKGIENLFGSDVNYDLLSTSLHQNNLVLGRYGKLSFLASVGKFLTNKSLFFPDFKHFRGNQILLVDQRIDSFLGLDYYHYSTPSGFLEAHGEYNLSGLLTSKVPGLRRLKLEELLGLHYLHTPELTYYGELHLGLQWQVVRLMYAYSQSSNELLNANHNFRIALRLF